MELVTSSFWVRGISFTKPPLTRDDVNIRSVMFFAEKNEYQEQKYPGTFAYRVVQDPSERYPQGKALGWVPGELCEWMMKHQPDMVGEGSPRITNVVEENDIIVGVEISFQSDEVMPNQMSTRR
jgi:hypothetical protein